MSILLFITRTSVNIWQQARPFMFGTLDVQTVNVAATGSVADTQCGI